MKLLRVQEGALKRMTDSNGSVKSPTTTTPDPLGHPVNTLEETLKVLVENAEVFDRTWTMLVLVLCLQIVLGDSFTLC